MPSVSQEEGVLEHFKCIHPSGDATRAKLASSIDYNAVILITEICYSDSWLYEFYWKYLYYISTAVVYP